MSSKGYPDDVSMEMATIELSNEVSIKSHSSQNVGVCGPSLVVAVQPLGIKDLVGRSTSGCS